MTTKLKHVNAFLDRHDKPRALFRRTRREKALMLPVPDGMRCLFDISDQGERIAALHHAMRNHHPLMEKYTEYLTGTASSAAIAVTEVERPKLTAKVVPMTNSMGWLVAQYRKHTDYTNLADGTRVDYDPSLDMLAGENLGGMPLLDYTPQAVRRLHTKISTSRKHSLTRADKTKGMISLLWRFALNRLGLDLPANPTTGIKKVHKGKSHLLWPDEVTEKFLSTARPAVKTPVMLMRQTALREGDVICIEWDKHFFDDGKRAIIKFTPKKTSRCPDPVTIEQEIDGELLTLLRTIPRVSKTIVANQWGRPFANSQTMWRAIKGHLRAIGCGQYTPHGLRHASLTEVAEAGGTEKEVMALGGIKSPQTARVYTDKADRVRSTKSALAKRRAARTALRTVS